jgi:alpha-L-fucosidase 2
MEAAMLNLVVCKFKKNTVLLHFISNENNKMNKNCLLLTFVVTGIFAACTNDICLPVNQVGMNWQYDTPAQKFWEGLPIGTGRFGAMIPGAVACEVVAFNDETLWTGGPYNSIRPDGPETVKRVREHAFAKEWRAANDEARRLFGVPATVQFYQPMGRLNISLDGHDAAQAANYSRRLNMDCAIVDIAYTLDGVR